MLNVSATRVSAQMSFGRNRWKSRAFMMATSRPSTSIEMKSGAFPWKRVSMTSLIGARGYLHDLLDLGLGKCSHPFSLLLVKCVPLINCQAVVIGFLLFGDSDPHVENGVTRANGLELGDKRDIGLDEHTTPPESVKEVRIVTRLREPGSDVEIRWLLDAQVVEDHLGGDILTRL